MNKNINNAVELTEKDLACVCGGQVSPDLQLVLADIQLEKIDASKVTITPTDSTVKAFMRGVPKGPGVV